MSPGLKLWHGLLLAGLLGQPALAHQSSDAYLRAASDADGRLSLRAEVALRDLDLALDLDADGDGRLSWGEVRGREQDIADHVAAGLRIDAGRCTLQPRAPLSLDRKADGSYAVLQFGSDCAMSTSPRLAYGLMLGLDPTHRGLLVLSDAEGRPLGGVQSLAPGAAAVALAAPTVTASAEVPPAPGAGFFKDGLHHILIGADHVLFLVCLMLPLLLGGSAETGGRRVWPLIGLVTAFTIGHSITLGLASWRVLSVSPDIIEPLIALTIALTAWDNLRPFLGRRRALAALAFGLIHGFGFAGPLLELELPPWTMAAALLQFNLGVEAGQLIVVALAMLLLWPLRGRPAGVGWMRGGSAVAGLLALVWLGERVLDFKLLPV